jgi:hypothetical protein
VKQADDFRGSLTHKAGQITIGFAIAADVVVFFLNVVFLDSEINLALHFGVANALNLANMISDFSVLSNKVFASLELALSHSFKGGS